MVNIFGAGSNQIVIYCDAINDFTYGFFPITITNIFSRETKTFKPDVITKNTRFIKLCFNLVSSQAQEDLSNGKIYIKAQGTFEFQVGNSGTFNTNVSLMNPYRIVEVIEAQVALREQEVQYTSFISENEDLTSYVFLDDDPCPDGNCPPTDCYIPSVGERYGGGLVYQVDTQNRIAYIAGQTDIDGIYDWGGFGKEILSMNVLDGKIDTEKNLQQIGQQGQAADIITGNLVDGYSDWYLPSLQQYQNARSVLGTSLTASNRIYWTSKQAAQIGFSSGVLNEIYNSNLFTHDNIYWQDVKRDASVFNVMGVFTGAVDSSNTIDDYPYEVRDLEGRLTNEMFWQGVDGDAAIQQIGSVSFGLENNTFYTYRAYFKATGTQGEINLEFVAQNWGLTLTPKLTLKFGNDVTLFSTQALEAQLNDAADGWYRLEVSLSTLTGGTNVSVSQIVKAAGSNPDFYWYYSCPTFRKGYFNRHAPFVGPGLTPVRINRQFNNGLENPVEGTFSVTIQPRTYEVDDLTFQDINCSYFTTYTHSHSLTLHAKNNLCRYVKVSTNNNPPYDMENPFAIVDLDTSTIVRQTTSSMNWIFNNFNINDTRWLKSRVIFSKEYKKDIWGEYTSWLIGSSQSAALSPRFYYDLLQRTSDEDITLSFYCRPQDDQSISIFAMNTSESVFNEVRYNPQTKTFPLIQTGSYVVSATATPNFFGDWDKVTIRCRIPTPQSTLRYNFMPYPGGSTNFITNNAMIGAVVGNPGTLPTNYLGLTGSGGIIREVVGLGEENGFDYIDVRFSGTASATFQSEIRFTLNAEIPASQNQVWIESFYAKVISAPSPPANYQLYMIERGSGGAFLVSGQSAFTPTSTLTRYSFTRTLTNASTISIQPAIWFGMNSGVFYNFTLRIASPQMERGNIPTGNIRTTGTAVTQQRNINICGVGAETGTVSTDAIFTNGNTIFYRNDLLSKWATPNGNPTFSFVNGISPESTNVVRINFAATYSVVETPALTGLALATDYVFSVYVKEGTSGPYTPNFSLEIDNMPAGSTQQGSSFTWAFNGSHREPTTTSSFAGIRSVGSGWYQIWHRVKLGPSGAISNIQAEFRSTPTTPGNFYVWNPLVEQGLTPSVLPRVYRRPSYFELTPLSKDWTRIDNGSIPYTSLYNNLDNRLTFTPLKTISGSSNVTDQGIEVWGAQATSDSMWRDIYPIENFTFRTFIPHANQQGTTNGYYTAYGYNPILNKTGFYRKDLYFKIKPFREQTY